MSTIGENIDEIEKQIAARLGCRCRYFQRGLCLPSDIKMTAEEQDAVIEIVRSCFA